jgi:hypothetical protein
MSLECKAELFMAIKNYECEERQGWDRGVDFVASDAKSNDKILLRVITEPKSRSGVVGVDAVKNMAEIMEHEQCAKGVLISKSFSNAAKEEMNRKSIQRVSEEFMPPFKLQTLYITIYDYVDDLCKAKCGKAPEKKADCKGYVKGHYHCNIRLISDNAAFHFAQEWRSLLQHDFMRLLAMRNSVKNQKNDKAERA